MTSTNTYAVIGMTCAHCVQAVSEEIGALPGVQDVSVELVTDGASRVQVVSEAEIDETQVRAAVAEAGYELVAGP